MLAKLSALAVAGALILACGDSREKPEDTTPTAEAIFPPKVDEPARGGTVLDGDGNRVELASAWGSGRAVVIFYRGNW